MLVLSHMYPPQQVKEFFLVSSIAHYSLEIIYYGYISSRCSKPYSIANIRVENWIEGSILQVLFTLL